MVRLQRLWCEAQKSIPMVLFKNFFYFSKRWSQKCTRIEKFTFIAMALFRRKLILSPHQYLASMLLQFYRTNILKNLTNFEKYIYRKQNKMSYFASKI